MFKHFSILLIVFVGLLVGVSGCSDSDTQNTTPSVQKVDSETEKDLTANTAKGKQSSVDSEEKSNENLKDTQIDDTSKFFAVYKAAQRGDADAQFELGMAYYDGKDIKTDMEKAVKWLTKAGEQGHLQAQYEVGIIYEALGNRAMAKKWLNMAASRGHWEAKVALAVFVK